MSRNTFYEQALLFFKNLQQLLTEKGIALEPQWDIDHLCYRTPSEERYEALKKDFTEFSKLLIESEINGRMIATFQLSQPLEFLGRLIDLVELPAPKKGKTTPEGFEHIEIVCDVEFAEIEKRWPNFEYEKRGLEKLFNQELEMKLGDTNIKFHQLSLRSVIELESNLSVWQALKNSKVLEVFKAYQPLVAGTFPLGVHTKKSDLDILLHGRDLNIIRDLIKEQKNWGAAEIKRSRVNGLEALTANFVFEGVPFEIFAQARPPIKQQAYRHFLIEEKILKYRDTEFAERIRDFRRQGLKTEPAFAIALQRDGDPYEGLLKLESLPPQSLAGSLEYFSEREDNGQ